MHADPVAVYPHTFLDQLMSAADLAKVISLLMETEYAPELEDQLNPDNVALQDKPYPQGDLP